MDAFIVFADNIITNGALDAVCTEHDVGFVYSPILEVHDEPLRILVRLGDQRAPFIEMRGLGIYDIY